MCYWGGKEKFKWNSCIFAKDREKTMKFMNEDIYVILKQYWGYTKFRSLQEDIILSVLNKQDTLALMPTGGGKSLTYQIAALAQDGLCVVITPLIALMKDQTEDLRRKGIAAEAIYTGLTTEQIESTLNKCFYNDVKFLYVSPERLASELFRARLKQMKVCLLAVDEAHCISQWGYDFRPSYLRIAEIRSFFPHVPVLALTATATPLVAEDIQRHLRFSKFNVLSKSFRRENLSYVVRSANDKLGELVHILSNVRASAIVYVRKRDRAEQLAHFLKGKGISADYYHAGLSSVAREERQDRWKTDKVPVIVATNAFGMGIDKPDVRVVVHFDIPDSPEAYFQEAGRAGRDGKKAYAVLLYNAAALAALKTRVAKGFPDRSYIKKVYDALGNYFQIAEGSGAGYAFEFDVGKFVKNFSLDMTMTISAINILEMGGYLECTTEINSRSRVVFLISRDNLNGFVAENDLIERLLVVLMRKYAGIFVQSVFINEQYLADELKISRREVYESLIALARKKILSYVPGNDRPYIVYHQPRLPLSYINIGKEAYEDRKKSYTMKVNEMINYIENKEDCRQLLLMRYFGQKEKKKCGLCDVCIGHKKAGRTTKKHIDHYILTRLKENDTDLKELINQEEWDRNQVIERIRFLLDEEIIYYKTPQILAFRKN